LGLYTGLSRERAAEQILLRVTQRQCHPEFSCGGGVCSKLLYKVCIYPSIHPSLPPPVFSLHEASELCAKGRTGLAVTLNIPKALGRSSLKPRDSCRALRLAQLPSATIYVDQSKPALTGISRSGGGKVEISLKEKQKINTQNWIVSAFPHILRRQFCVRGVRLRRS
jgi:hypothetical protein